MVFYNILVDKIKLVKEDRISSTRNNETLKNLFLQLGTWIELKFGIHDKWYVWWFGEFLDVFILSYSIDHRGFMSYNTVSILGCE